MPYPKKGESQKAYVARAIPMIKDEHPELSQDAAIGRAFGMFRAYRGGRRPKHRRTLHENARM